MLAEIREQMPLKDTPKKNIKQNAEQTNKKKQDTLTQDLKRLSAAAPS